MTGAYDSIPDQSGMRSEQSQTELGTDKSGCGIQRCHIREALRRLSIPSGPLLPMAVSRYTHTHTHTHSDTHTHVHTHSDTHTHVHTHTHCHIK